MFSCVYFIQNGMKITLTVDYSIPNDTSETCIGFENETNATSVVNKFNSYTDNKNLTNQQKKIFILSH